MQRYDSTVPELENRPVKRFGILLLALIVGCGSNSEQKAVVQNKAAGTDQQPNRSPIEPTANDDEADPLNPRPTTDEDQTEPLAPDERAPDERASDERAPDEQPSSEAESEAETLSDVEPTASGKGAATSENSTDVSEAQQVPAPDNEAVAAETKPAPKRFILLAPSGPLIVDLVLRINGEAYEVTHERLVEEALAAADEDQDGQPTWEEVANSPRFAYGQFGNLAIANEEQKSQLIRMYDRDRDSLVDRDELPRFLTRNAGGGRAFSLRSSNEYRSDNRTRSPVRLALDTDLDGAITDEEFRAAPARLLKHDSDDDEIVVLNDFKSTLEERPGQMSNRRRTTEPDTALLIDDRTKWNYAEYSLRELYAYGDQLKPSDWPMVPELYGQLDQDQNQLLDKDELEGLADVPAHVELLAEFGAEQDTSMEDAESGPRLDIEIVAPEIEAFVVAIHRHGSRISVELRDAEVEFFVNEDPSLINYRQVAQNQFVMLDEDKNGYLDEDEFPDSLPGFAVPLEAVDQNGDGQVYAEELAKFLYLRQAAYRGQVRARAADQEDALFTALDHDGDGRLNAKEIHRSSDRLRTMDHNDDGRLQSHEIPGSMVVGFIRGNPQQDNALFTMPTTNAARRAARAPRWFQGMDANGDGEISSREFVGTNAKFQHLDTDGDGFVSTEEVEQDANQS